MDSLIVGIGDEVILSTLLLAVVIVPLLIFGILKTDWRAMFQAISAVFHRYMPFQFFGGQPHEEPPLDNGIRVENVEPGGVLFPARTYHSDRCPICLNGHQLAVETNCGHVYCGNCLRTYIYREGVMMAITCPMCRQSVTVLFPCFTEQEMQSSPTSTIGAELELLQLMIENYNRRFSGAPRSLWEIILDTPTLLRHLWNEFFSVGGLLLVFRIRIVLCFMIALLYLISPLDMIPEAVFGIVGLLDDLFVMFIFALYMGVLYRRFINTRQMYM